MRLNPRYVAIIFHVLVWSAVLFVPYFFASPPSHYATIGKHDGKESIPMVKIKLNEKDAWFIVDTGASATVINKAMTRHFGIADYEYTNLYDDRTEINGLGGTVAFKSAKCRLDIGTLTLYPFVLKSPDLNSLFSFIGDRESVAIAGILGSDILSRYHFNINYESMTISTGSAMACATCCERF